MKKILPVDVTQLISELAMLLEGGISINNALEIVQQEQEKAAMYKLIGDIQTNLAKGMSLADSWAKYPQYFAPFLVEMLRQSQNLATTLAQIAEYRESIEESEMDLVQEMEYPFSYLMIVVVVLLAISSLLLTYVTPIFADMFYAFGAALPIPTQFIIDISDFVISYWWLMLGCGLGLGVLLWFKRQTVKLYIPLFGHFYHKLALVRCLRTCAFMLSHKAPLPKAFEAAAQAVNNSVYAKLLRQASQEMRTGTRLPKELASIFPKKVIHAMTIGTHTNQFDKLLVKLADVYTKQLYQMIAPIVRKYNLVGIVVIAALVGIFVIAMYMPIFLMGSMI